MMLMNLFCILDVFFLWRACSEFRMIAFPGRSHKSRLSSGQADSITIVRGLAIAHGLKSSFSWKQMKVLKYFINLSSLSSKYFIF